MPAPGESSSPPRTCPPRAEQSKHQYESDSRGAQQKPRPAEADFRLVRRLGDIGGFGALAVIARLYDRKNALVAADILSDRVLPSFEEHGIPLLRVLTDRGTEYCGKRE